MGVGVGGIMYVHAVTGDAGDGYNRGASQCGAPPLQGMATLPALVPRIDRSQNNNKSKISLGRVYHQPSILCVRAC